jgi:RNA recognition motif. (a.k.a. RRM, RBD, or RNP domain)
VGNNHAREIRRNRVIWLGGIDRNCSKEDVADFVTNKGFTAIFYWLNHITSPHPGWCRLQFSEAADATRAVAVLKGVFLGNSQLRTRHMGPNPVTVSVM